MTKRAVIKRGGRKRADPTYLATTRLELDRLLAGISDAKTMGHLLEELMTSAELRDLTLRLRLLELLQEGMSQRKIAELLGVSLCKITRGSKVLRQSDSVIAKLLRQKMAEREK